MARKVVPETRIASCLYALAHDRHAQVVLAPDGTAGYAGVIRCGLRACPWCAGILEAEDFQRALRVNQAWADSGSIIAMVTFTMSHKADESLKVTKDAFLHAKQAMYRSRRYKELAKRYGLTGNRYYHNELTDGGNGWHFHQHECEELRPPVMPVSRAERKALAAALQAELWPIWIAELAKQGRTALPDHAVRVTVTGTHENPETAARYLTKAALETTHTTSKGSLAKGKTPFEHLDDADDKSLSASQRARARARYREFVTATRGMHWTWFSDGCDAGPDPEDLPWADDQGTPVLDITDFQWRCLRSQDRQVWLLELVERCGPLHAADELRLWTDSLRWSHKFRWLEPWQERPGGELMDVAAF